jgi:hypothetical protein
MSIKLGPGLVDAVVAYLTANLPAKLNAEEAVWNDGVVLDDMNEIVKRDPDQPERISNPPYLYVFVESSTIYDIRADSMMSVHTLICWLVAVDSLPEVLRVKIGRYGNALVKALNDYDTTVPAYRLAEPSPGAMPSIDFGMTLTNGTMAMNDVRVETHWTVRES